VVHGNPVADLEPTAVRTDRDHLARRFVPGDDPLVRLRAMSEVLPVDRADVTPADRRRSHPEEHLAVPDRRDGALGPVNETAARQDDTSHTGLRRRVCAHALTIAHGPARPCVARRVWS
jgi:hypothetical protein